MSHEIEAGTNKLELSDQQFMEEKFGLGIRKVGGPSYLHGTDADIEITYWTTNGTNRHLLSRGLPKDTIPPEKFMHEVSH